MTKRISLLLLTLSLHLAAFSQTESSLIGNWIFKDVANKEKIDASSLSMLKQIFGGFTMDLKADHHFKLVMGKEQEGTWSYSGSDKKLTLKPATGNASLVAVNLIDANTLEFAFDKNKALLLQKGEIEKEAHSAAAEKETSVQEPLAAASPEQLCKKWYFQGRVKPNTSKEMLEMTNSMFKGSFFEFNKNQTYHLKLGDIAEEDGKWALAEGNTNLNLSADGEQKTWLVKRINSSTLVLALVKNNVEETWTFSATK